MSCLRKFQPGGGGVHGVLEAIVHYVAVPFGVTELSLDFLSKIC